LSRLIVAASRPPRRLALTRRSVPVTFATCDAPPLGSLGIALPAARADGTANARTAPATRMEVQIFTILSFVLVVRSPRDRWDKETPGRQSGPPVRGKAVAKRPRRRESGRARHGSPALARGPVARGYSGVQFASGIPRMLPCGVGGAAGAELACAKTGR